ncbi:hypothetical protein HPB48_009392 [Haemaphysalis longicornis]|uniref:Uncharacterized protein n=1 Tax=Haemaphysalis longicornis TaxID=44386 RepID=A0A9J6GZ18_HAELO|nr:hypothetical protein HPB48_009392 [Haemaphysalis longicornis]
MDLLLTGLRQGRHVYTTFPKEGAPAEPWRKPQSLHERCRRAILARATLRVLKGSDIPELSSIMRRRLTTLEAKNCVEVDCAPFVDTCGYFIYHRTLAYRVRCSLDGSEYMATYGGTCSLMQLAQDIWRWQWVYVMHENIMCIYALVLQKRTSNIFATTDVPQMTQEGLEIVLVMRGLCFPEPFLCEVAQKITSAIMYVEERLSFGRCERKIIYVNQKRILIDNKLTWKSNVDTSPHQNSAQSVILGDKVSNFRRTRHRMYRKLAGHRALASRRQRPSRQDNAAAAATRGSGDNRWSEYDNAEMINVMQTLIHSNRSEGIS